MFFINHRHYRIYEVNIFAELVDNEPWSCSRQLTKMGHIKGIRVWPNALLIVWWDWSRGFIVTTCPASSFTSVNLQTVCLRFHHQ